jgi:hypothetical protein
MYTGVIDVPAQQRIAQATRTSRQRRRYIMLESAATG